MSWTSRCRFMRKLANGNFLVDPLPTAVAYKCSVAKLLLLAHHFVNRKPEGLPGPIMKQPWDPVLLDKICYFQFTMNTWEFCYLKIQSFYYHSRIHLPQNEQGITFEHGTCQTFPQFDWLRFHMLDFQDFSGFCFSNTKMCLIWGHKILTLDITDNVHFTR